MSMSSWQFRSTMAILAVGLMFGTGTAVRTEASGSQMGRVAGSLPVVGAVVAPQAESATGRVLADAFVLRESMGNFGTSQTLDVGYRDLVFWPRLYRSFIRFELPSLPHGAEISSAALVLRLVDTWDSLRLPVKKDVNVEVCPVLPTGATVSIPWSELGVTWFNQPKTGSPCTEITVGRSLEDYSWDVTAIVDNWYKGTIVNEGFRLRSTTERESPTQVFASREASDPTTWPRLLIDYVVPPQGPSVFVEPATAQVVEGQNTTVEVWAGNIENLYGFQIEMTFDKDLVNVVDSDPGNPGTQIKAGEFFKPDRILRNVGSNTRGVIEYAASLEGDKPGVSGSGPLARITFTGVKAGTSPVAFTEVVLSDAQSGTIDAAREGGEIEVTDANPRTVPFTVQGQVGLERRGSSAGAQVCAEANCVTTDGSGRYTLPGVLADHTLAITHPSYLRTSRQLEPPAVAGQTVTLPDATLLGGDVDQDGGIRLYDLTLVGQAWNARSGDARWGAELDITDDGVINIKDAVAVEFNMFEEAPGPWLNGAQAAGGSDRARLPLAIGPGLGSVPNRLPRPAMGTAPRGVSQRQPTIRLDPVSTRATGLRLPVRMAIQIDGVQSLFAYYFRIAYNPEILRVRDASPDQEGVQIFGGDFLDVENLLVGYNEVDDEAGDIRFAVTQTHPATGRSGSGLLGTILFEGVIQGTSPVVFTEVELYDDTRPPAEIRATWADGEVTIASGRSFLFAPFCSK